MGTVVGAWRVNMLIFLTVIVLALYLGNGFFMGIEDSTYRFEDRKSWSANQTQNIVNDTEQSETITKNYKGVAYGLGDYLTFGNIENGYARILINLVSSICWIAIGYIIYTFVKEWVPFV